MPNPPINRSRILALLKEAGPMTRYEIAEHLDWPLDKTSTTINSMRYAATGKLLRIVRYKQGVRIVAVFAADAGKDAPRPRRDHKKRDAQKQKRYVDKNRAAINAKNRLRSAAESGKAVAMNPWLQLAPPNMRPTVMRISRESERASA